LELVQASRSPTVISVALQLPASEKSARLIKKFASNTSLWEILRQFESGEANYNFTQRGIPQLSSTSTSGAGRLNYETPVITIMPSHRELSDFVELQQTLTQIGFDNGSASLRLSFKDSGKPLEQAMAEISQYFKGSEEPTASEERADPSSQFSSILEQAKAALLPETPASETPAKKEPEPEAELISDPMEIDSAPASEPASQTIAPPPENTATKTENIPLAEAASNSTSASTPQPPQSNLPRNVQIFAPSTSSTPQAARQAWNERDYVPTIEHAKIHQAALLNRTRNQRLLSDKELEAAEAARLEKLASTAINGGALRVRMPDGVIIQMDMSRSDTADALYDFVTGFLERKNEPFQLKHTNQTGKLVLIKNDKKRLIQDLGLSSRETVTFVWDEGASDEARVSRSTLAEEWKAKAQELKVEEPVAVEEPEPVQTKAEGKKKSGMSIGEKEARLKNLLGGGKLFGKKK
jgi:tether containing UBX domain for GLUT4